MLSIVDKLIQLVGSLEVMVVPKELVPTFLSNTQERELEKVCKNERSPGRFLLFCLAAEGRPQEPRGQCVACLAKRGNHKTAMIALLAMKFSLKQ